MAKAKDIEEQKFKDPKPKPRSKGIWDDRKKKRPEVTEECPRDEGRQGDRRAEVREDPDPQLHFAFVIWELAHLN